MGNEASPPLDAATSYAALDAAAARHGDEPVECTVLPCGLKVPKRGRVRIVLKDEAFAVIKDAPYVLRVEGETFEGNTGQTGLIEHRVLLTSREGKLEATVKAPSGRTKVLAFDLAIGDLDPHELEEGCDDRLANLGVRGGKGGREATARSFRRLVGVPAGDDAKTKAALLRMHSSGNAPIEVGSGWVPTKPGDPEPKKHTPRAQAKR